MTEKRDIAAIEREFYAETSLYENHGADDMTDRRLARDEGFLFDITAIGRSPIEYQPSVAEEIQLQPDKPQSLIP